VYKGKTKFLNKLKYYSDNMLLLKIVFLKKYTGLIIANSLSLVKFQLVNLFRLFVVVYHYL